MSRNTSRSHGRANLSLQQRICHNEPIYWNNLYWWSNCWPSSAAYTSQMVQGSGYDELELKMTYISSGLDDVITLDSQAGGSAFEVV